MSALDDLLRYRFLESVHDTTDGDRFRPTNVAEVAAVVGLSKEAAEGIAQFLVDEGLLKWHSFGGFIVITHAGRKEVEQARREPAEPTQHFLPANYIHIEHMTGSQLQQGTTGSVQQMSQTLTPDQSEVLTRWLDAVRAAELGVAAEVQAEVDVQLATIDAQMKSARPLASIVRGAGQAVVEILKSASAGAAIELAKRVPDLFR
jgi:hypothetical protein